jgi:hypothetical protein
VRLLNDNSTNPSLLREVADWQNHPAWVAFRDRFDLLLRRLCRGFGLDAASVDEVCQRAWTVEETAHTREMSHTAGSTAGPSPRGPSRYLRWSQARAAAGRSSRRWPPL